MAQPTDPFRTTANNNGEVFGGELPHYTQLMQVGDPQTEVSETFGNEAVSFRKGKRWVIRITKPLNKRKFSKGGTLKGTFFGRFFPQQKNPRSLG